MRSMAPWLWLAGAGLALFAASFLLMPYDDAAGAVFLGEWGGVGPANILAFAGSSEVALLLAATAALLLAWKRRPWAALRLGLVPILAVGSAAVLKLVFHHPRPDYALIEAHGFGFPSGHATTAAALAVLLVWFASASSRGWLVASLLVASAWASLMALSRLVLGVHSLSDVVAGIGVGMAVAGLTLAVSILMERRQRPA